MSLVMWQEGRLFEGARRALARWPLVPILAVALLVFRVWRVGPGMSGPFYALAIGGVLAYLFARERSLRFQVRVALAAALGIILVKVVPALIVNLAFPFIWVVDMDLLASALAESGDIAWWVGGLFAVAAAFFLWYVGAHRPRLLLHVGLVFGLAACGLAACAAPMAAMTPIPTDRGHWRWGVSLDELDLELQGAGNALWWMGGLAAIATGCLLRYGRKRRPGALLAIGMAFGVAAVALFIASGALVDATTILHALRWWAPLEVIYRSLDGTEGAIWLSVPVTLAALFVLHRLGRRFGRSNDGMLRIAVAGLVAMLLLDQATGPGAAVLGPAILLGIALSTALLSIRRGTVAGGIMVAVMAVLVAAQVYQNGLILASTWQHGYLGFWTASIEVS